MNQRHIHRGVVGRRGDVGEAGDLHREGEAVSRPRRLENWILQPLPFPWGFHVNIKVFAHGLLFFLGAWPEPLGSAVQFW